MNDTDPLIPKTKPTEPVRKVRVTPHTRRVLDNVFGRSNDAIPLSMFISNFESYTKKLCADAELNPATFVVKRVGARGLAIEYRKFIESEDSYLKRWQKYQVELSEYEEWARLSQAEKARVLKEIKKRKKVELLQRKKDALKTRLNEIAKEIETLSHSA